MFPKRPYVAPVEGYTCQICEKISSWVGRPLMDAEMLIVHGREIHCLNPRQLHQYMTSTKLVRYGPDQKPAQVSFQQESTPKLPLSEKRGPAPQLGLQNSRGQLSPPPSKRRAPARRSAVLGLQKQVSRDLPLSMGLHVPPSDINPVQRQQYMVGTQPMDYLLRQFGEVPMFNNENNLSADAAGRRSLYEMGRNKMTSTLHPANNNNTRLAEAGIRSNQQFFISRTPGPINPAKSVASRSYGYPAPFHQNPIATLQPRSDGNTTADLSRLAQGITSSRLPVPHQQIVAEDSRAVSAAADTTVLSPPQKQTLEEGVTGSAVSDETSASLEDIDENMVVQSFSDAPSKPTQSLGKRGIYENRDLTDMFAASHAMLLLEEDGWISTNDPYGQC